jgi:hypothetical protein
MVIGFKATIMSPPHFGGEAYCFCPVHPHMVSLLPTKFHEILFSSFRGVALTNCVTDRWMNRTKTICLPTKVGGRHNSGFKTNTWSLVLKPLLCLPPTLVGRHIVFVLFIHLSVTQFVSATPLKLQNKI